MHYLYVQIVEQLLNLQATRASVFIFYSLYANILSCILIYRIKLYTYDCQSVTSVVLTGHCGGTGICLR